MVGTLILIERKTIFEIILDLLYKVFIGLLSDCACYPFTVSSNKCGRSCNTINDPYAPVQVPAEVENISVKVFNVSGK